MDRTPPASLPTEPWEAARYWRWYKARLVKGGAEVACELYIVDGERDPMTRELTTDQRLVALISGDAVSAYPTPPSWPWRAIDHLTFRTLLEQATWARSYAPHIPIANPRRPADLKSAPLPF